LYPGIEPKNDRIIQPLPENLLINVQEVYQEAFVSGAIAAKVDQYASLIRAANPHRPLIDLQAYDLAVDSLLDFVEQRRRYLAGTSLLVQP
jgi:hypothetical protein